MIERRPKLLRASNSLYARLLSLYPAAHRREYGWLLNQAFQDMSRDAYREQGGLGLLKVWLAVSGDLLKTASWERLLSLKGACAMVNLKRGLTGNLTSTSQDRLGGRITCCGGALFTMVLLLCKLPPLATNGTELAVGLGLAALMSVLLFVTGLFAHRLSFGRHSDPSLASEFKLVFCSRKSTGKMVCIWLSLLTLVLGTHAVACIPFTPVQLVIAVEGVFSAALALVVLAIWIGPTGASVAPPRPE
jgi:hypothetical protein